MITRIRHGRTKLKDADTYVNYVRETGVRDYLITAGILSAKIFCKVEGDICHFYTLPEWKDLESIVNFAAAGYNKAKYYPAIKRIYRSLKKK